ncbi:MAG: hypothetical protein NVV74_19195 [Magnetospirillum sp.]|nr:hypothetical protein [Magnetospirillum sp.]
MRLYWLSVRLLVVLLGTLAVATFSLSAFALAPLHSWLLYGDWRFWRHWHNFPRLTRQVRRVAFKLAREPDYRGMTAFMSASDWLGPPMSAPDRSLVTVRADWPHAAGTCGSCGRCCTEIGCPSFDPRSKLCASYDSPFWRYFPCGRYPATQAQIDYYGCPKWAMLADALAMEEAGREKVRAAAPPLR